VANPCYMLGAPTPPATSVPLLPSA
jgi:hypothetical protein